MSFYKLIGGAFALRSADYLRPSNADARSTPFLIRFFPCRSSTSHLTWRQASGFTLIMRLDEVQLLPYCRKIGRIACGNVYRVAAAWRRVVSQFVSMPSDHMQLCSETDVCEWGNVDRFWHVSVVAFRCPSHDKCFWLKTSCYHSNIDPVGGYCHAIHMSSDIA